MRGRHKRINGLHKLIISLKNPPPNSPESGGGQGALRGR
jgi:hypothetical protein